MFNGLGRSPLGADNRRLGLKSYLRRVTVELPEVATGANGTHIPAETDLPGGYLD